MLELLFKRIARQHACTFVRLYICIPVCDVSTPAPLHAWMVCFMHMRLCTCACMPISVRAQILASILQCMRSDLFSQDCKISCFLAATVGSFGSLWKGGFCWTLERWSNDGCAIWQTARNCVPRLFIPPWATFCVLSYLVYLCFLLGFPKWCRPGLPHRCVCLGHCSAVVNTQGQQRSRPFELRSVVSEGAVGYVGPGF